MGLHNGISTVYGSGSSVEPITLDQCDWCIDQPDLELDELRSNLLRCVFRDLIQSIACDDNDQCQLRGFGSGLWHDLLLEGRGQE
jgi:hypothetical protein